MGKIFITTANLKEKKEKKMECGLIKCWFCALEGQWQESIFLEPHDLHIPHILKLYPLPQKENCDVSCLITITMCLNKSFGKYTLL